MEVHTTAPIAAHNHTHTQTHTNESHLPLPSPSSMMLSAAIPTPTPTSTPTPTTIIIIIDQHQEEPPKKRKRISNDADQKQQAQQGALAQSSSTELGVDLLLRLSNKVVNAIAPISSSNTNTDSGTISTSSSASSAPASALHSTIDNNQRQMKKRSRKTEATSLQSLAVDKRASTQVSPQHHSSAWIVSDDEDQSDHELHVCQQSDRSITGGPGAIASPNSFSPHCHHTIYLSPTKVLRSPQQQHSMDSWWLPVGRPLAAPPVLPRLVGNATVPTKC